MVEAVVHRSAYAHDGEANEAALLDRLAEPLVARGDELPRDGTADDLVDELVRLDRVGRQRLHEAADPGELARASGLLLVRVGDVRRPGDRLAVGDLRLAGDHVAVVLATHALHVDVEM